jgi:hypothetical protein
MISVAQFFSTDVRQTVILTSKLISSALKGENWIITVGIQFSGVNYRVVSRVNANTFIHL